MTETNPQTPSPEGTQPNPETTVPQSSEDKKIEDTIKTPEKDNETPSPSEDPKPTDPQDPEAPKDPEPVTPKEPTDPPTDPVTPKEETDWKQKFSASSREAHITVGRLAELQKTLGEITKEDIPTDEEMKASDPDWDMRSDFEQNLAVKQVVQDRKLNRINLGIGNIVSSSERTSQISTALESNDKLAKHGEEFVAFTEKQKNKDVPVETLVKVFLFDKGEAEPDVPSTEEKPKVPTLESGNGSAGRDAVPISADGKMTPEQEKHLRTTDPKKYNEMIRKGQLK